MNKKQFEKQKKLNKQLKQILLALDEVIIKYRLTKLRRNYGKNI
jgi:hypothetical protein